VLGVFALGAGGCGGRIPLPTFPQLQEVGEIGEYGTRRLRASDACRKASETVESYVDCMEARGWTFIGRDNLYPAPECWSLRTAGDPRQLPTAQCFHEAAAPRPAPSATPGASP
jgi:hypothetical protein